MDCSSFKLWKKDYPNSGILEEQVLFSSLLAKKSGSSGDSFEERHFALSKNYLYYKVRDIDKKIRGYMDLKWVRVEFSHSIEDIEN